VVQDTGSGSDNVTWGTEAWYEWIGQLLYVLWAAAVSAAFAAIIVLPVAAVVSVPRLGWWLLLFAATSLFFPVVVISTMVGGGFWAVVHPRIVARFITRPLVPAALYANTALFAVPCLVLGWWLIVDHQFYLLPLVGLLWTVDWLCYARLIGRAGLVLTEDEPPPLIRRKRKRSIAREEEEVEV
jgi:hypothetical protein